MKITKDFEANAAYLYLLEDCEDMRIDHTMPIIDEKSGGMINIDFSNGKVFGIEFLPASLIDETVPFERIDL